MTDSEKPTVVAPTANQSNMESMPDSQHSSADFKVEDGVFDLTKSTISQEHRDFLIQRHGTDNLNPIPSFSPNDPYNWSASKKNFNLFLISFHALMTTWQAAIIIPAYGLFAEQLEESIQSISYLTSAQIIVLGFAPLFWKPLSSRFGRLPIWLISTVCCGLFNIGCALSTTYSALMACRVLSAFFIAPPIAIGSGIVVEMFFAHERGQKMGIWTLLATLGPVSAPFFGGFISYHAGTQWLFYVLAIVNFVQFFVYLFFGSETRYVAPSNYSAVQTEEKSKRFRFRRIDKTPITVSEVVEPFTVGRHLTVLIPAIAYSVVFCFGSVLLTVEIPQVFIPTFHLNAQELGLNFIALIIGTVLGEQASGPLSDILIKQRAKKLGGQRPEPEFRIWLSYLGFATVIIGMIVFGVQVQNATPGVYNVTPMVGAAIAAFGNQVVTTALITYAVDCHPNHGSAVGTFIVIVRQTWGFIGPFWFPPMFVALGYAKSFGMLSALVFAAAVIPTMLLQIFGRKIRKA